MTRSGIVRTAVFALALLFPLSAFAAPTQYQLRVDGLDQLRVDGLACPFCAYGIEKELNRTAGVAAIAIDINAGTVTVTMAEGATLTEARAGRIVKDAGFTLRAFEEVRAPAGNK